MYITKMTEDSGPGMKVILMDRETVSPGHINILSLENNSSKGSGYPISNSLDVPN